VALRRVAGARRLGRRCAETSLIQCKGTSGTIGDVRAQGFSSQFQLVSPAARSPDADPASLPMFRLIHRMARIDWDAAATAPAR